MSIFSRINMRHAATILVVTTLLIPFQNCGVVGGSNRPETSDKSSDGGGTDGKTGGSYVSYGLCDSVVGVKSSMVLAQDGKSARLLVKDCEPLNSPSVIDAANLQFVSANVFIYDGTIYDLHVLSGTQKVTLQVCQVAGNPALQTHIWKTLGSQSAYFGRLKLGNSSDSGDLLVQTPAVAAPTRYVTQAGQNSNFDLVVNGINASIQYSLKGGPLASATGLACLDQSSPMTDDGSARAPAGSPQKLNLLNSYAVRPSWKVAGVDFAVGNPSNIGLKNPAQINMPGVSVDLTNHLIRVTGNNVTLDGYDFTMGGGFGVYVVGADRTTITNSRFSGSNIQTDAQSSNLTVSYCNIDGGTSTDSNGFVYMLGSGHIVLEYNWIRGFPGRILVNDSGESAMMRYNLIEDSFGSPGFNYLTFSGGRTYAPIRILFNTIYQSRQAGSDASIGFILDGMSGSTVTAEFAYNTMVTVASNNRASIGTLVQASTPGTVTAAWLHHNYVDSAGANAVFANDPTSGITNFYSHNFEMNSGALLSAGR